MIKVSLLYQRLTPLVGIDHMGSALRVSFFCLLFYYTAVLCLMESFFMVSDIVVIV